MDLQTSPDTPTVDEAVEGAVDILNLLLWVGLGLLGAVVVAFVWAVAFRLLIRRKPALTPFSRRGRSPLRATLVVLGVYFGVQVATRASEAAWEPTADHLLLIAFIACLTWLAVALVYAAEDLAVKQHSGESNRARRVRTQMQILRRVVVAIIVIFGFAGALLTFDGARTVGASLLASAGIVSVVAGLAAQTALANVFAGMQLAFSDAIRVDDIVVVEGEWGRIEEITLTYVVVHVWDDRRLIMPSTYFTSTPFENWTRRAGQLLGTVEFSLDWTVPVAAMRHELDRILAGTDLWDHRVGVLQVEDTGGERVIVRALLSGPDSATLTDLKYYVRESLLLWLQREARYALPRTRVVEEERLEQLPEHPEVEVAAHRTEPAPRTQVIDVPAPPRLDPEIAARQERELRRARRLARRRADEAAAAEPAAARTPGRPAPSQETTRIMTPAELGLEPTTAPEETTAEAARFFTATPEGAARAQHFRGPGQEALEERERTAERHRSGFLGDPDPDERPGGEEPRDQGSDERPDGDRREGTRDDGTAEDRGDAERTTVIRAVTDDDARRDDPTRTDLPPLR